MWRYVILCIVLMICRDVRGDFGDQMAEVIQKCCDDGSGYARNHTKLECDVTSASADVPEEFRTLCVIAQSQCCKEYFKKKEDCDTGVDVALSAGHCSSTKGSMKVCCDECSRGSTAGLAGGAAGCVSRGKAASAEELLSDDAYIQCCMKSANEGPPSFTPKPEVTVASLCEDYAPNELCAHHCIPVPGSYKCECNPGYMLMSDGRNCREVVTNRCKPRNPCQHKCFDNGKEMQCSCRRGYELKADGKSCQDIDECKLATPVCLPEMTCHNIQGSYRCIPLHKRTPKPTEQKGQCPSGFARNIKNNVCDDINECKLPRPPCPSYLCENTVGGYKCGGIPGDPINLNNTPKVGDGMEDRCPHGFALGTSGECEDVDECASLKDDCNRLSQFCVNTHSSFYCQDMVSKYCPPGFKIDAMTNRCEDINECEEDSDICRRDQICVNHLGKYDCKQNLNVGNRPNLASCPDGMRKNPKTLACEDIDECVEGTHLCDQHQRCINTEGSHECHCKLGYQKDPTTGACMDINECATQQHDCSLYTQRCDNTVGSYLCVRISSCGSGYILQHTTGKCEDVDECALGIDNCADAGPRFHCANIPGSFRCNLKIEATTSTTPVPEYEFEYYDSDEETDQPSNSSVDSRSSETTPSSVPSSPGPSSTEAAFVPEQNKTEENPAVNEILPNQDPPKPINYIPEVPRYIAPLYPPTEAPTTTPKPEISELPRETNHPDIVHESNSESPQKKDTPESTYYESRPEKPVASNEITFEQPPEEIPIVAVSDPYNPIIAPGLSEQTSPRPTYSPYGPKATSPKTVPIDFGQDSSTPNSISVNSGQDPALTTVLVNAGEETATISGVLNQDGSVQVDTKDVPKNEWTKIDLRPIDCPLGFEANENGGCFDIDECATFRHSCSGITEVCRNTIGGYMCDCAPGFQRDHTTVACVLIATTSSTTSTTTTSSPPTMPPTIPSTTTPEPVSSTTEVRTLYGYPDGRPLVTRPFWSSSRCDAGFQLNSQTNECEDIDECTNGQATCAQVEICINTNGGYLCECPPNWKLDDVLHRCLPVSAQGVFPPGYGNEPAFPPDSQETISQGTNNHVDPEITQVEDRSTVLKCPWGYRLGDDNTCVDVDECVTGEARCGFQQFCVNQPGGYVCSCRRGYNSVGDHQCADVDECALAGNTSICSRNADCFNTPGSYQCQCHDGFRTAPVNDKVCVDVDECTESRAGSLCQHRCSNVWGSYRCLCHRGYRLSSDNRTCVDVDECVQFKSKIPCVGKCQNTPGSYRCECPIGYRLSEDKRSCIDIDECETGQANCQTGTFGGTSHVCFNTRGSHHCHRITCPQGYELENKHRCTKTERVCRPGDWQCAHQPTTISYNFITFVSKLYVPDANVKLFTMRGPSWPFTDLTFDLRLVNIDSPPSVRDKADINAFLLTQNGNEAVISLVRPLEGPQSIELELSMELHSREQFGGIAIAKVFIYVSEYEF